MGLISRVSSRTYRNPKLGPTNTNFYSKWYEKVNEWLPRPSKTRRQEKVFRQPTLRKESQELWSWTRYPTKTRLDPIRPMAKIHQTSTTTIRPPSATQGSSFHQPVLSNS